MESPEHQKRLIRNFLQLKDPDDAVVHLEKVASEGIFGRHYDVWDVHTDRGRWWVITNPPFRYDQAAFKSMDVALSFHVGLMQRVVAHRAPLVPQQERDRLAAAWRKWTQAAEALDEADEAEEFQSVAMRARESLLSLTRALRKDEMVPEGEKPPQWDNFTGWAGYIARAIAQGRLRSYLIGVATESWQYVNSLTHDQNANRFDAEIAIDVASNVLQAYGRAFLRWEGGGPDRCPSCTSYRLTSDYRPELPGSPYVTICEACGWESAASPGDAHAGERQPPAGPPGVEPTRETPSTPHVPSSDISTLLTPADVRRTARELDAAERARKLGPAPADSDAERQEWQNFFAFESSDGRIMDAHRVAFIDANGPTPPGTALDQKCHDPSCVNPAHTEAIDLPEPPNGWSRVVFEWVRPRRKTIHACASGVRVGRRELVLSQDLLEHFHLRDATMLLERHFFLAEEPDGWVQLLPAADRLEPGKLRPARAWLRPTVPVARNDPCPCGSGRKYKNCHGA